MPDAHGRGIHGIYGSFKVIKLGKCITPPLSENVDDIMKFGKKESTVNFQSRETQKLGNNHGSIFCVLRHTLMSMVPVGYRSFTAITAHELALIPDTIGRENPRQIRQK